MSSEQQEGYMFTEQEEQEIQSEMMCNGPTWWDFDYNRREEPQYAAWKADSRWQRICRFLRRGLWHVTSIEGWDGIQASGEVRPNTNNKYSMSYPQAKMSLGYNHSYTALFDFVTPGEEAVIRCWDRAKSFLCPMLCRVLLQFDRQCLQSKLIQNCAGYDPEKRLHRDVSGNPLGFIPHIEVWYPEPISTNAICEAYLISNECDWDEVMPFPLHVGHD